VATNVQHREFLLFDTMTSTPTYSNYELVNQSVTMPMITSLVGSAGHYFDLNPQASTDYVINHTSDMFWLTDKGRPGFYDGTTVEQLIAIPATASPATKTCTTYPTVVNGVVTSC
jgi:hypothetical protein